MCVWFCFSFKRDRLSIEKCLPVPGKTGCWISVFEKTYSLSSMEYANFIAEKFTFYEWIRLGSSHFSSSGNKMLRQLFTKKIGESHFKAIKRVNGCIKLKNIPSDLIVIWIRFRKFCTPQAVFYSQLLVFFFIETSPADMQPNWSGSIVQTLTLISSFPSFIFRFYIIMRTISMKYFKLLNLFVVPTTFQCVL